MDFCLGFFGGGGWRIMSYDFVYLESFGCKFNKNNKNNNVFIVVCSFTAFVLSFYKPSLLLD